MQCNGAVGVSNGQRGAGRAALSQGQRLSAAQVNVIVKLGVARSADARGELVVGEGSPTERQSVLLAYAKDYSGHSLHVGAAQDMAAVGIVTAAVLQAGGWKDERMVRRYIRKLGALEGGMAQFFGRGRGRTAARTGSASVLVRPSRPASQGGEPDGLRRCGSVARRPRMSAPPPS